mmetsp:Transcript_79494/g.233669  ORF Transcript_79494/g.233669 Transcript_79494/m.233669 type:complete len:282 (-) Transcript_79494:41-886(-)
MDTLLTCIVSPWRMAIVCLKPRKRPVFAGSVCLSVCLLIFAVSSALTHFVMQYPSTHTLTIMRSWPRDSAEVTAVLDATYHGLDGLKLSASDAAKASEEGTTFQKTYGEFAAGGVEVLLDSLNVTTDDVFCDLGSGIGKVVMQAYLERRPKEAIGIELSEARHRLAEVARDRLLSSLTSGARLTFVHGDVFDSDSTLARCSKIFVCSTVWPLELLERMEQKLVSLEFRRTPVLVASSKQLRAFGGIMETNRYPGKARFVRHARVDTSWGASFISLYALHEN